ncbi:sugar porter family MFS transporter [Paenibacillus mesophilus]|uniref:sugar porter family MFS transporter n=1 Tax=Paenibacillus mesophilus TaxID=2582849 RepID=UPI00110DF75C|nr:sugar porter family MFS transporter [Paenibacillus mesophilus]TMV44915.1 sugar porter family MFS transporter [Paenibacillus mesophilus]
MNETAIKSRAFNGYTVLYSIVAAIGGFLFGYDTAVISGAIGFITTRFDLEPGMVGWTVSSLIIGATIGAACSGVLSDKYGRKKMLVASALLFSLGAFLSALPPGVTGLVIARIIGGIGVGMTSTLSPLYIAEISPARNRGRLVSIYQFAVVTGIFVTFFINAGIAGIGDDAWDVEYGWRWMFGFGVLPGLLYLILLAFIPESPRWLMKRKEAVRALDILERMNGKEAAKSELDEILNMKEEEAGSVRELLSPALRLPLFVGIVLAVLQQITGINAIMYYAPEIFKQTGAGTDAALTQTVWIGIVNFGFTLLALWLIDKAGRKLLLVVGSVSMTICLFMIGYCFHTGNTGYMILFFILLYVASFAISFGPVVWVMIAEIFPTRIRGRATAIASFSLWAADYAVSQTFPMLIEGIGTSRTFWLFTVISVISVLFCVKVVPETKGKTLEQIERQWKERGR